MSAISDAFRRVADEIDHNAAGDFAGAYCIVSPAPEGEQPRVLKALFLDSERDYASFLGIVGARIKLLLDEIADAQRQGQQFRR